MPNPLFDDRDVDLILNDLVGLDRLLALPAFAGHDRQTIQLFLDASRSLARERLFPAYRSIDSDPPKSNAPPSTQSGRPRASMASTIAMKPLP